MESEGLTMHLWKVRVERGGKGFLSLCQNTGKETLMEFFQAIPFLHQHWFSLLLAYLPYVIVELFFSFSERFLIIPRGSPYIISFLLRGVEILASALLLFPLFFIFQGVKGKVQRIQPAFFRNVLAEFFLPYVVFLLLMELIYFLFISLPAVQVPSGSPLWNSGIMIYATLVIYLVSPFPATLPYLLFIEEGYVFRTFRRWWRFILAHYFFFLLFILFTAIPVGLFISGIQQLVYRAMAFLLPALGVPQNFTGEIAVSITPMPLDIHGMAWWNLPQIFLRPSGDLPRLISYEVVGLLGIPIFFLFSVMVSRVILRRLPAVKEVD